MRHIRFSIVFLYVLLFIFFLCTIFVSIFTYSAFDLPSLQALRDYEPPLSTKVYSDDYELMGKFFEEDREIIPFSEIPERLIHAVIAAEDAHFYTHKGIDPWGIIRAMIKNIVAQGIRQGGSTITQQVAKTFLLTKERTIARKIKEFILANRIENNFSKDHILYLYLNQIYFGHSSYGIGAAAKNYFDKNVTELTLGEIALLAGLPQAPSLYSPFTNLDRAQKRQKYVLKRMVAEGYISKKEAREALDSPIKVIKKEDLNLSRAPYFLEHVRKYLVETYGNDMVLREGLKVYTTASLPLQEFAEMAVKQGLDELSERQGYTDLKQPVQGALIAVDPHTGYVRALVGGYDFQMSEFNRATQALRQPGSAFKPIVYAAALDSGYTPATVIIDSPIVYDDPTRDFLWKPTNYGQTFHGDTLFRSSLIHSFNITTIKIVQDIGIDYVTDYAKRLGIMSPLTQDLSLSLGSSAVTLLELVTAYAHFPSLGKSVLPIYIKRVEDRFGRILEENTIDDFEKTMDHQSELFEDASFQKAIESEREERVIRMIHASKIEEKEELEKNDIMGKISHLDLPIPRGYVLPPETAYIMTHMLRGVIQSGTGMSVLSLDYPAAGKTGTTNEYKDAWFIGYIPTLATGVWVGFDEIETLGQGETGARAASPIWLYFMREVVKNLDKKDFTVPEKTIDFISIDSKTGRRATSTTKNRITEAFLKGMEPEELEGKGREERQSTDEFFFEE